MKNIITLLEEHTLEDGSFTLTYNDHKVYRLTDPEDIADYYLESGDDEEREEFLKLDLSKPIYFVKWFPRTPIGSYLLFANTKEDLIKNIEEMIDILEEKE